MPEPLDRLASELRGAVMSADHALAERLARDYCQSAQQLWESLSESERAASTLAQSTFELLTWARGMTIVQRIIDAEQLAAVQKLVRYAPASTPNAGVQVRG